MKGKQSGNKLQTYIQNQEAKSQVKNYKLGEIKLTPTEICKPSLVNFFGDLHSEIFSLRVRDDDKYISANCSNGDVRVYELQTGQLLHQFSTFRLGKFPCTGSRWLPIRRNNLLTLNCDGSAKWFSMGNDTSLSCFEQSAGFLCGDYQTLEQWCVVSDEANQLTLIDNETHRPIHIYPPGGPDKLVPNQTNRIFSVKCFKDNPNSFISGGWDGSFQLWDARVHPNCVQKLAGALLSADTLDIRGTVLLSGNYDNSCLAQLWELRTGTMLRQVKTKETGGNSYCFGAKFLEDSEDEIIGLALSGSNKVVIMKNGQLACQIQTQATPFALDFYRYHGLDFVAVAGDEGPIYCMKLKWIHGQNDD